MFYRTFKEHMVPGSYVKMNYMCYKEAEGVKTWRPNIQSNKELCVHDFGNPQMFVELNLSW